MHMCNLIPLNLNFILYLRNLSLSEDKDVFPWLPIHNNIFLPSEEFDTEAKHLWNLIIFSCVDEITDHNDWSAEKFDFAKLFRNQEDTRMDLEMIKKCYFSWFKYNWKIIAELYSGKMVEKYYHLLSDHSDKSKLIAAEHSITLQFVYTAPPAGWDWYTKNSVILSPETDLMDQDKITEKLKQIYFEVSRL